MVEKIANGLKALGVKGSVRLMRYDSFTIEVVVNNERFGLWDTCKNTFVD